MGEGTARSYSSGFASLSSFCDERGLTAMPVDAVTLGAWLVFKSEARGPERADKQITPVSLKKYLSGQVFAGITFLMGTHGPSAEMPG